MPPINGFMGLQTSLRGLLAQQRALDVTSHNIANANTEGYSRQEAVLETSDALQVAPGKLLGTGVDVAAYRRVRDTFLDHQYRAQGMQVGSSATRSRALDQVELRLAEPGQNGIAAHLGKLYSSWSDLANAPESGAARQALVEQAKTLATAINELDRGLQTVAGQAAAEHASIIGAGGELQQIASDLGALNSAIRDAEATGAQPNDLLDHRDQLLDRLSGLAQVSVTDDGSGSISVTVGGAASPLVSGGTVTWPPPAMASTPGGKLGALAELASPTGTVATYRADLAGFAQKLAADVNGAYNAAAGVDFFTYDTATATLALNPAVTPATLRAGAGATGDTTAAIAISEQRGRPGGADQLYAQLVTRIGNDTGDARRAETNATVLADSIDDRRQSTSGVSLDEEMTNLIRFQRGYQASARAMSTTDEMLDVLINRTGRVGL
jgi:flagellar hook-associated protein 1 FlgK